MLYKSLSWIIRCLLLTTGNGLLSVAGYAQEPQKPDRLLRFFQANFDSTIIYHAWSSWYPYPNYYILARQANQSYYFTYKNLYRESRGVYMPGGLRRKFSREEITFQHAVPDTNRYFLAVPAGREQAAELWRKISALSIWQAQEIDDSKTTCVVDDGPQDTFYLITRTGSNTVSYYAAEQQEQCGPPNNQRQRIIRIAREIIHFFDNPKP